MERRVVLVESIYIFDQAALRTQLLRDEDRGEIRAAASKQRVAAVCMTASKARHHSYRSLLKMTKQNFSIETHWVSIEPGSAGFKPDTMRIQDRRGYARAVEFQGKQGR